MTAWQKAIKYAALALAVLLIAVIILGIVSAVDGIAGIFRGESAAGDMESCNVGNDYERLYIDIKGGQLEIRTGDSFALKTNHKYLKVSGDGKQLSIRENDRVLKPSVYNDVKVILTIPKGHVFDRVEITTGAGTVDIQALEADYVNLELGAGEVTVDRLAAYKASQIETGAGRLTLENGDLQNLDLELGVGEVRIQGKFLGDCRVDMGVGQVTMELLGSPEEYSVSMEKGIGQGTLDGKPMESDRTYGTGPNKLRVEGGVGSIDIDFVY